MASITTTTAQPIKMHGWTIEAGTTVEMIDIVRDGYAGCSTVTCRVEQVDWNVCLPMHAFSINVWDTDLPRRYLGE